MVYFEETNILRSTKVVSFPVCNKCENLTSSFFIIAPNTSICCSSHKFNIFLNNSCAYFFHWVSQERVENESGIRFPISQLTSEISMVKISSRGKLCPFLAIRIACMSLLRDVIKRSCPLFLPLEIYLFCLSMNFGFIVLIDSRAITFDITIFKLPFWGD